MVLYLLLNALVSVLVSGTVLFFYDRATHTPDCSTSETIPTLPPGSVNADIVSVGGAGALVAETVILQNNGDTPLLLTGWTLKDGQSSTYTFPQLTLYPGGIVEVHSGTGTNTAADLFWGLTAPAWRSGELVALYDTQNIARAFYRIP
jgi:competence protein ComEC